MELAAGIIACVQAADLLAKCSISLYRIGKRAKGARKDINKFADDVEMFGLLLGTVHTTLQPFTKISDDQDSNVLKYLKNKKVLRKLFKKSNRVTDEIAQYVPIIEDRSKELPLITIIKWVFRKGEIEAFSPKMESIKSAFTLVLSCISLEDALSQPRTDDNDQKIKHLERKVRRYLKALKTLQGEFAAREDATQTHWEPTILFSREVQDALRNLGKCMIKERRVPGYEPPTSSSSTASSTSTSPPSRSNHSRTSSTNDNDTASSANTSQNHSDISNNKGLAQPQSDQRPLRRRIQELSTPIEPLLVSRSHAESSRAGRDRAETSQATIASPPGDSDFLAVHEDSNLLVLDPSTEHPAESGFVLTQSGPKSVVAKIDESLGANLITQSFAIAHNLDIKPLDAAQDAAEGMRVQIGAGEIEQCVGKVKLRWCSSSDKSRRQFSVHCWVCVHGVEIGDLVFGRPFLIKKEHYGRRG